MLYNLIIICYFHLSIICYIMFFSLFHFDNSNWGFWTKMQKNLREPEKQLHFLVLWQIVLLGHKSMLQTWRKQVANCYLPILYPWFNFSSNFNLILLYNLIIMFYFHLSIICYTMFFREACESRKSSYTC